MRTPRAPRLDERRSPEFAAELRERARTWIPDWELADGEPDFGRALLEIAARFNSEVAERLDGAGEKMRRGFLDWLAVRGSAARPARLPVVFKLIDAAREAVLASHPVRMQADAASAPVVFETETDVRVVPGRLEVVVGVDAEQDAFYLPPPGLNDLKPLEPLPTQWQTKSFAAVGATMLQLEPEGGLIPGLVVEAAGQQYRIVQADKDLVTIEPPLVVELNGANPLFQVTTFSPFDSKTRNQQAHALYLGDAEALNIETAATLDVVGAASLITGVTWQYWGKVDGKDEVGWQPLTLDSERQQKLNDAVALKKPKGAIESREIAGRNSRWIRAYCQTVGATEDPFTNDQLSLRINFAGCEGVKCPPDPPPASDDATARGPRAEGMANTTPLVLENVFFPLGREPRQFDAFYLGSQEAFSKKDARVQLCFEMADRTFSALAALREGPLADAVLAGVAQDRSLHLLSFNTSTGAISKFGNRNPLQPPRPGHFGNTEVGNTVALDAPPPWRLPVWFGPHSFPLFAEFLVGASAGDTIWIWRELPNLPQFSGWFNFGRLSTDGSTANRAVDGLVYLAGTSPLLAALCGNKLFTRVWPNSAQWDPVATVDSNNITIKIKLRSIVPVLVEDSSGRLVTSRGAGMLGIDDGGRLFQVTASGLCTRLLNTFNFAPEIRPVAINISGNLTVAAVTDSTPPVIVADDDNTAIPKQVPLDTGTKVLAALEAVLSGGTFHVLATVRDDAGKRVITWAPFEADPLDSVFKSPALGGGLVEGAPLAVDDFVVVPGARADILVSKFDPTLHLSKSANVEIGVVVPDSVPTLEAGDLIVRLDFAGEPDSQAITDLKRTKDGEVFYSLAADFVSGVAGLDAYDVSATLTGAFALPDQLTLAASDLQTVEESWLLIGNDFFKVDVLDKTAAPWVATISTTMGGSMPATGSCSYVPPIVTSGRVAPFMRLDPATNGDWDAGLLTRIPLRFPDEDPSEQRGAAFEVELGNKPVIVVLDEEFLQAVDVPAKFLVDAAFGEWLRDIGDTSTNPELSWEYWNGKGWWNLTVTLDDTQNLKTTGAVQFEVPADIASSDWAGKTNHWIRARLIGGDYGREKVTVNIQNVAGGTQQTVERSSEGIRAPQVLKLHISYAICGGVQPEFLLTQDSGATRDQSDANRTPGAIVEAFMPLAVMLNRLVQPEAAPDSSEDCPPECDCGAQQHSAPVTQTTAASALATASSQASGRALFLGLAATPSEGPVNVLLLVAERDHRAFAPLKIDALVADRFVPVVANDATRALGESGLLSMSFAVPPTPSDLFGKSGLTWLRLTPKAGDGWTPALRGAYLNAVWASATETLTRELLGSSDGEPHLTVRLARPPVLNHTLELRVKEPLGEEERAALLKQEPNRVLSAVEGLPGDWVLWEQVIDPDDEPASARVYALDEATGEIRFGDGQHGRIPPIGRDAIVAFRYCRTELDPTGGDTVPGNNIAARTALNLISPVETVESVTAADQSAGGAPPESDERVLRFGFARLRHRERAVTARDLEDLALQSSPDIVQARALTRRGHIRLVVVMRGKNPQPNAAQVRELRRLLLDAAPVALRAPNALRIAGPQVRRLRIDLTLKVDRLNHAGALAAFVKQKLAGFFDTATGGVEQDGWALGLIPNEGEIAFALSDAPHLESIGDVKLREITDDGKARMWPEALKPNEIVLLADDPIRIQFETAEVMV